MGLGSGGHRLPLVQMLCICIVTFWKLGIRHTRCDLSRIQHGHVSGLDSDGIPEFKWRSYDPHASPTRYTPREIRRIRKEDAFLLNLLDELMEDFELEFDTFGGNMESFFNDIWKERMRVVFEILKKEDSKTYTTGRREMGVVMDAVSGDDAGDGNEDEDEQISDQEGDTSSDDEVYG